jgi:hypothetical protein
MTHGASFKAITSETNEQQVMAAVKNLPWDEWVKKYTKCDHCAEIRHICSKCSKYLAQIESGEIKHPEKVCHDLQQQKQQPCVPGSKSLKKNYLKDPKAKAFLSAFQALFSSDSEDNEDHNEAPPNGNQDENKGEDEDLHDFLSMVRSLQV